jgi:hypothetical protein
MNRVQNAVRCLMRLGFQTIVCLAVSATCATTGRAQGSGYSYSRSITINHTKVPNTDQTNFPVLIAGTYSYLATTGNGGNVTNSNGYDIIFTSDAAGANMLAFERQSYNASTGAVTFWVKVPTLSHTTDTVIYLFYGNSSVTTDQSNKTAVWDSNYLGVWHMSNGVTLNGNDSTANGNNGSTSGVTAVTGIIADAASYSSSGEVTTPLKAGSSRMKSGVMRRAGEETILAASSTPSTQEQAEKTSFRTTPVRAPISINTLSAPRMRFTPLLRPPRMPGTLWP